MRANFKTHPAATFSVESFSNIGWNFVRLALGWYFIAVLSIWTSLSKTLDIKCCSYLFVYLNYISDKAALQCFELRKNGNFYNLCNPLLQVDAEHSACLALTSLSPCNVNYLNRWHLLVSSCTYLAIGLKYDNLRARNLYLPTYACL